MATGSLPNESSAALTVIITLRVIIIVRVYPVALHVTLTTNASFLGVQSYSIAIEYAGASGRRLG
jgi:hypothetical protein